MTSNSSKVTRSAELEGWRLEIEGNEGDVQIARLTSPPQSKTTLEMHFLAPEGWVSEGGYNDGKDTTGQRWVAQFLSV